VCAGLAGASRAKPTANTHKCNPNKTHTDLTVQGQHFTHTDYTARSLSPAEERHVTSALIKASRADQLQ